MFHFGFINTIGLHAYYLRMLSPAITVVHAFHCLKDGYSYFMPNSHRVLFEDDLSSCFGTVISRLFVIIENSSFARIYFPVEERGFQYSFLVLS